MDNTDNHDTEYDGPPVKMCKGNEVDIRILVPYKGAGVIIGKCGENIRRLRDEFSAKIHLPNNYGPERILHMTGECQNLLSILKETLPCIEDCNHDGDVDLRVLIHTSHAGIIIGQGGQQINELRKNCNLRILKVFPKTCPRSSDRVLKIMGRLNDVLETLQIAVNMIKDSPIKGPREDYDARNCDPLLAKEYGGWGNPNSDLGLPDVMHLGSMSGGKRSCHVGFLSGKQTSILGDDFAMAGLGSTGSKRSGLLPDSEVHAFAFREGPGLLGAGEHQSGKRLKQSLLSDLNDYPAQGTTRNMRGRLPDNLDDLMFDNYSTLGLLPDEDSRAPIMRSSAALYSSSGVVGGGILSEDIEIPRKRISGPRGVASSGNSQITNLLSGVNLAREFTGQKPGLLPSETDVRGMKRMLPQSRIASERILSSDQPRRGNNNQYSLLGAGNSSMSNQFNSESLFKQITTLISLPDHLIGPIMGSGGSRIKSIRQESGADITVSKEKDPCKNERTVTIKGTQEQIQMAQELIHICVKNYLAQH